MNLKQMSNNDLLKALRDSDQQNYIEVENEIK